MKIAAGTNDGKTISRHLNQARYYLVMTVKDDKVIAQELRQKAEPGELGPADRTRAGNGAGRRNGQAALMTALADCEVVLSQDIGAATYYELQQAGIRPILTTVADIHLAVIAYLEGCLADHPERILILSESGDTR